MENEEKDLVAGGALTDSLYANLKELQAEGLPVRVIMTFLTTALFRFADSNNIPQEIIIGGVDAAFRGVRRYEYEQQKDAEEGLDRMTASQRSIRQSAFVIWDCLGRDLSLKLLDKLCAIDGSASFTTTLQKIRKEIDERASSSTSYVPPPNQQRS
jgi:hypothetical protein